MSEPTPSADRIVYRVYRSTTSSLNTLLWLLGGCGLVLFAIVGFLIAAFGHLGQFELHLVSTLPSILAVALFAKAWSSRSQPSIVKISPAHLVILRGDEEQILPWDQIGWSCVDKSPVGQQRRLRLYDNQGALVIDLYDSFSDFNDLIERVQAELAARTTDAAETIRLRKAKRSALILVAICLPLLFVVAGNIWLARNNQRAKALLESSAVPGEAKILRRFVAPNGVTRRLEYEISADGQTATRNAEVTSDYWDSLENSKSVPVRYVPAEPSISRLVAGEAAADDLADNPLVMYGLSAVMGTFIVVALAVAAMQWRGWDLDLDSKSGKLSFKPYGTGK